MRFAIIIPAFNCENYIAEAIASALEQRQRDLEVIVVDDGSTDGTLAKVEAIKDPRLKVLSQPNSGVMTARRAGFEICKADAVVFLDGDDRLQPNTVSRYEACFSVSENVGLIYGSRVLIDQQGQPIGGRQRGFLNPQPNGWVLERMLTRNFISTIGQTCIRSDCLRGSEALKSTVRRAVDWVLYCEIACSSEFLSLPGHSVVQYRVYGGSMARRLADSGTHATDIADVLPAIDEIYALAGVARRFTKSDLVRLRTSTRGSAFAWKGQELLRARRWRAARKCFLKAIRDSQHIDLRDLLCLALTLIRFFPPGTRGLIGVP